MTPNMKRFVQQKELDVSVYQALNFVSKFTVLVHKQSSCFSDMTVAKENETAFLIKAGITMTYAAQAWYHLLAHYDELTYPELAQTGFFVLAVTFQSPLILEIYRKREEIAVLFNSIRGFSKRYDGMSAIF